MSILSVGRTPGTTASSSVTAPAGGGAGLIRTWSDDEQLRLGDRKNRSGSSTETVGPAGTPLAWNSPGGRQRTSYLPGPIAQIGPLPRERASSDMYVGPPASGMK